MAESYCKAAHLLSANLAFLRRIMHIAVPFGCSNALISAQITVYVQSRLPLFCVHFITHRYHQATINSLNHVSSRGQIGMERSRLIELEEKANSLQGKIGTQRKAMGGVNAAREANIQVVLLTVAIHILVLTRA